MNTAASISAPALSIDTTPSTAAPVSASESLDTAIRHHLAQRYDEAEALYRRIIERQPAQAAPKHWLGFMLQQRDRLEEAHILIGESLRLDASHAGWHFNFGVLLARMEQAEQAVQSFLNAIALDPQSYFSWTNLGSLYEKAGDTDKAEKSYLLATQLDPDCPDAYYLLSALYVEQGRFPEAKRFHCLGFVAGPVADKSRIKLSMAYRELGRTDEAMAVIDAWLAEQPDHPEAQHLAIAYKGLPPPQRCSDAYVESTYDAFAESFESTLSKLKYAGPQALADELQAAGFSDAVFDTLDLGCGTGLNGAHLKTVSSLLTGIDLSRRMLDQAALKASYDRLVKAEICAFLTESTHQYDLITCMDALIYFGALDQFMQLVARNLKPGGWLILTTEKLLADGSADEKTGSPNHHPDYRLNISGRYSHTEASLRNLLSVNGFALQTPRDLIIRMEAGMPIPGQIMRAQKLVG